MPAISASHRCAADSTSVSSTVCRSKVERLMTLSTSVVAACCCRASLSSRAIRASFLFSETKTPLRERRDSSRLGRCALVRSSPKHDELWSNAGQIGILLLAGMVPLPRLGAISAVCCGFALVVPNFFQGVCELSSHLRSQRSDEFEEGPLPKHYRA